MLIHSPKGPKAIIGLGNPGSQYVYTRHNIGFRIVDVLVDNHNGVWRDRDDLQVAEIVLSNTSIFVIKPQNYMNNSGIVVPFLKKRGIACADILVVHDELEMAFGKIDSKTGGSARGHNGLRSIIAACGPDFMRLRVGIGRPERKEDVSEYVLARFDQNPKDVELVIDQAVDSITKFC